MSLPIVKLSVLTAPQPIETRVLRPIRTVDQIYFLVLVQVLHSLHAACCNK